ncbi:unnamed protein product [Onchocerca flexuosa]|uniref:Uncharacterized protein n=1 Tax=Onchocerca flexuosa TaxID=387005 RepID=A0A183HIX7_9BILA|nr:unnamed protein product [Onchocerca flexuosa]
MSNPFPVQKVPFLNRSLLTHLPRVLGVEMVYVHCQSAFDYFATSFVQIEEKVISGGGASHLITVSLYLVLKLSSFPQSRFFPLRIPLFLIVSSYVYIILDVFRAGRCGRR